MAHGAQIECLETGHKDLIGRRLAVVRVIARRYGMVDHSGVGGKQVESRETFGARAGKG